MILIFGKYNSIGRILDCGSKGWGFESPYLPVSFYKVHQTFFALFNKKTNLYSLNSIDSTPLVYKSNFLNNFYKLNYNLLNEGLLIDFIQKKSISNLLKKFIFKTFYIFNEKIIFDFIVFYLIDYFFLIKNYFINFKFLSVKSLFNFWFSTITVLLVIVNII